MDMSFEEITHWHYLWLFFGIMTVITGCYNNDVIGFDLDHLFKVKTHKNANQTEMSVFPPSPVSWPFRSFYERENVNCFFKTFLQFLKVESEFYTVLGVGGGYKHIPIPSNCVWGHVVLNALFIIYCKNYVL